VIVERKQSAPLVAQTALKLFDNGLLQIKQSIELWDVVIQIGLILGEADLDEPLHKLSHAELLQLRSFHGLRTPCSTKASSPTSKRVSQF